MSGATFSQRVFQRAPFLKTALAVCGAMSIGDILCQKFDQYEAEIPTFTWDPKRTSRMSITGFLVIGPGLYYWTTFSEKFLPGSALKACGAKSLAMGCIMPVFISASFTTTTLLAGGTLTDAWNKIKVDLLPASLTAFTFWPMVAFLQFRYVAIPKRFAVGGAASSLWNIYLSRMINLRARAFLAGRAAEGTVVNVGAASTLKGTKAAVATKAVAATSGTAAVAKTANSDAAPAAVAVEAAS